jgi:type IV fimbrial biogenesis protein FimT
MNAQKTFGFTLIELMVTVSIAAIVLTLGVPGYTQMIQNNRMSAQANEFVAFLNLARSEAIKRGTRVTLCKSADGASCSGSGAWDQGWIVIIDTNNNATADEGAPLAVHSDLGTSSLLGNSSVASYISFVGAGVTQLTSGGFQAGTLTLCSGVSGVEGRSIVVSRTGRATMNKVSCS